MRSGFALNSKMEVSSSSAGERIGSSRLASELAAAARVGDDDTAPDQV